MPFARFGRMAACSRGRSEENLTQWPPTKGNWVDLLYVRICWRLAVTLGGCSASEVVQNLSPATALDLPQPNYRRVVADNVKAIIPNVASVGDLEISGVRLVDHLKGPAWLTCLKVDAHGKPQNYALFIQGDKIIDSRIGIVIDQCYKQTFEPFDLSPPPAPKKGGP
jgi:hypothetical protein